MTDRLKTRTRPTSRQHFAQSYGSLLNEGFNRRTLLKGFLATTAVAAVGGGFGVTGAAAQQGPSSLTFKEFDRVRDVNDHWPEGYERQVLLRWGDALFPDSPAFDLATLDGPAAERQFGYNNDFTAFLPLPLGSASSDRGLLLVSHECRPVSDVRGPHLRGLSRQDDRRSDPRRRRGHRRQRRRGAAHWRQVGSRSGR